MAVPFDVGGSSFTQTTRMFKVHSPVVAENTLLLDEFSGFEAVSAPFELRLTLLSEDSGLELKQFMGEVMSLSVKTASGRDRFFHGHVTRFGFISSDGGMATYEAQLGPWLEFLRYRQNYRIFQEMSVIDILRKVFSDYGALARFEIPLKEMDYKSLTVCVQYAESDLDFVSRLMEENGIYYHFRFEKDVHILVIEDNSTAAKPMPEQPRIDFNTEPGASKNDTIDYWATHRQLVPNHYVGKTFDFKKPGDPMLATTATNHRMGDLPRMEFYEHSGAYGYKDNNEGDQQAKLRIEEFELRSKQFNGGGNCRWLTCAHTFELAGHFNTGATIHDRTFFVMTVMHQGRNNLKDGGGTQEAVYRNSFTCVRKDIPYRPERKTAKPAIPSLQTATVVGPSGDEIFCDKYGRVKVQFHWDREGKKNDGSFCYVRVATQWAGDRFGMVSIPRIGSEVLVAFINGDPDRPIIVSGTYNESNMPPWDLPNNKTQSGILSRSTKGGGYDNANALRFEDQKGAEELWLHAERDQRIEVERDERHEVGHNRKKAIKHDEDVWVGNNRTEHVVGNETITIDQNRTETVIGNESIAVTGYKTTTIGQFKSETVALASTEQVGLARNLMVGGAYTLEIGAAMNTLVGGIQGTQVGMSRFVSVGTHQTTTIGGNHSEDVANSRTMTAGDRIELVCGSASLVMKKDGTIVLKGKDITVQSSSGTTVKASGELVLKGSKITEN